MVLKPLPYREIKRKLEAAGFSIISIKGSHVKFIQTFSSGTKVVIVPKHREVKVGTLRSIVRQMGISQDSFEEL